MRIKKINRITIGIVFLILTVFCISLAGCQSIGQASEQSAGQESGQSAKQASQQSAGRGSDSDYADQLFETGSVHTINIQIDEEDLKEIYDSPLDKKKYSADITIDGETITNTAISTKGGNSLRSVVKDENSNRYSYKINFGKNVEDQTYHGLDKLLLQNNFGDKTSLKSFTVFKLFREMGVAAPLTSYAVVTINGENESLYTIMEAPDESFMERNGIADTNMYKPDWVERIDGDDPDHERNYVEQVLNITTVDHGIFLKYSDDKKSSYADIFENAVNDVDADAKKRLISSLKALSEGDDPEGFLDTNEIITYFAVHNFVENYDGYTGGLSHNYYLCEKNGVLSMIPWDYDRSFCPFVGWASVDTEEFINKGIDAPLSYCKEEDRPMWMWIQSSEEYMNQYHEVMDRLADYCENNLQDLISKQSEIIRPYIAEDTTAFYTLGEYDEAVAQLERIVSARTESVRKQLDGTLAAVSEEQNPDDRIDCTGIEPFATSSGLEEDGGES